MRIGEDGGKIAQADFPQLWRKRGFPLCLELVARLRTCVWTKACRASGSRSSRAACVRRRPRCGLAAVSRQPQTFCRARRGSAPGPSPRQCLQEPELLRSQPAARPIGQAHTLRAGRAAAPRLDRRARARPRARTRAGAAARTRATSSLIEAGFTRRPSSPISRRGPGPARYPRAQTATIGVVSLPPALSGSPSSRRARQQHEVEDAHVRALVPQSRDPGFAVSDPERIETGRRRGALAIHLGDQLVVLDDQDTFDTCRQIILGIRASFAG